MNDVEAVKEALDELAKVIDVLPSEVKTVSEAARRWVRLVDGLDYEAGAKASFDRWQRDANEPADWELDLSERDRQMWVMEAKHVVDAAVGVEKGDDR